MMAPARFVVANWATVDGRQRRADYGLPSAECRLQMMTLGLFACLVPTHAHKDVNA